MTISPISIHEALTWMPVVLGPEFPGIDDPPPDLHTSYNDAVKALKDREWSTARVGFEAMLAEHGDVPLLRAGLALVRIHGEKDPAALDDLRDAAEVTPGHILTYAYAITLAQGEQPPQYARALPLAEQVTQDLPAWSVGWYMLGAVLLQMGENIRAEAAMTRALKLEPNNLEYRTEHARCLTRQERFEEALAEYEACIEQDPTFLKSYGYMNVALSRMGDTEGLIHTARRATAAAPDSPYAYTMLAKAFVDNNRPQEALDAIEEASKRGANPMSLMMTYARARGLLNRMQ